MRIVYLFLILFMSNITFAQTMLVVERPGTVKNYIYQAGQNIRLKTKSGKKISGPINIIKDSSLVVDYVNDLEIKDIAFVYKPRPLLNSFGTFFMGGSLLYIGLGTLNSDNLSENSSFKVAAGFFGAGLTMTLLSKKRMRIDNEKWRIKILK